MQYLLNLFLLTYLCYLLDLNNQGHCVAAITGMRLHRTGFLLINTQASGMVTISHLCRRIGKLFYSRRMLLNTTISTKCLQPHMLHHLYNNIPSHHNSLGLQQGQFRCRCRIPEQGPAQHRADRQIVDLKHAGN